jgi:hypothetical protein
MIAADEVIPLMCGLCYPMKTGGCLQAHPGTCTQLFMSYTHSLFSTMTTRIRKSGLVCEKEHSKI